MPSRRAKLIAAAAILAVAIGVPVTTHLRAKSRVQKFRAELRAGGEKLTIAEIVPSVSVDELRAAQDLMAAASFLGSLPPNAFVPTGKFMSPGYALVAWREPVVPTDESTNVWPVLCPLVARNGQPLARLRAALEHPSIRFDLDYRRIINLPFPYLPKIKTMVQWLSVASLAALHEQDATNAWEYLCAQTALPVKTLKEPILISELVRIATAAIALNTMWEALQFDAWQDEQLLELQRLWEALDLVAQAEPVLEMERAFSPTAFDHARQSYSVLSGSSAGLLSSGMPDLVQLGKEAFENPQGALRGFLHRYPGYCGWKFWQSYDDELASAKAAQAGLEAVRLARRTGVLGPAIRQFERSVAEIREAHPRAGIYSGLTLGDTLARFLGRIRAVEIQRALTVTVIALKRHHLKHGEYPPDLAALCPDFLPQVPLDPADGQPLRYRPATERAFVLYSAGKNGVDNGGDPAPDPSLPRQWIQARDAVWPWPASPDAVQADFEKLHEKHQRSPHQKVARLPCPLRPGSAHRPHLNQPRKVKPRQSNSENGPLL